MEQAKYEAMKALDEALDVEIIAYANKFAKGPSVSYLDMLSKLIAIDCYTDKYLMDHEEPGSAQSKASRFGS